MKRYTHTQTGYLLIVALGSAVILIALLWALYEFNWIGFAVLIILAICLVLFATLTVEIDEDTIEVRFGPGIIRKKFPLQDIESCRAVKNHWYYGWGIRWTPYGWMFNVSGLHAVELLRKNGKKFRVGTDDPEGLAKAIQQALGK